MSRLELTGTGKEWSSQPEGVTAGAGSASTGEVTAASPPSCPGLDLTSQLVGLTDVGLAGSLSGTCNTVQVPVDQSHLSAFEAT